MTDTMMCDTTSPNESLGAVAAELAARPYARRGVSVHDEPIRVMLVDDHAVVRAGLRALLSGAPDVQLVGEAADGPAAVTLAERLMPDVVVMDLDMPGGDGATATKEMMRLAKPPRVLILSMHSEEERLLPLLDIGANGYLSKDAAERDLLDAIRVVSTGEVYVRPRVARLLAHSLRERQAPDPRWQQYETLSEREKTVLRLTAEGYNGPEIGRQLGISPKTVDTYKQRIDEKLGLAHRTDYVRLALALDLLHK